MRLARAVRVEVIRGLLRPDRAAEIAEQNTQGVALGYWTSALSAQFTTQWFCLEFRQMWKLKGRAGRPSRSD